MNKKTEEQLSKFMSFILRHKPEEFDLKLQEDGSCFINELLSSIKTQKKWSNVTIDDILQVVKNCPKQRYSIVEDRIKANYGHSSIKVEKKSSTPSDILYHGTNTKVIDLILKEGIKPMGRKYVHLSEGTEFATLAGNRRGELVILKIDAKLAHKEGVEFFYAENDVWLSNFVPAKYLSKY